MSWGRALFCLLFGVLTVTGAVSAADTGEGANRSTLLFSSEPADATTGIKVTEYYVADDFQVGTSAHATSVSFKLGDWNGDFASIFDGLIRWWIHLDSAGEPGALHARGTAFDVTYSVYTPPGGSVYTTCYDVDFNLGQQVELVTGTRYWLVLNLNQGLVDTEFYSWLKCQTGSYSPACFNDGSTPGCTPSTIDLTFTLSANTEVLYLFADGFETGDVSIWSSSVP